ncbi:MAG TPA: OB-fold domain-containing protein [Dehalococcoidia bacterium]|nr:OB-fold domain-containing protein [Dehalococcoidia bacterium]
MTANAYKKPLPTPSPETKRFWDGCKKHELWIPFCRSCETYYWHPRDFCPNCFSWDTDWRKASGRGTIYTFAIQYRAWHPGWADDVPYVTALVDLEEGPRIYTTIVDIEADPKHVRCGMPVEVLFEDISDDIALPKFRSAAA